MFNAICAKVGMLADDAATVTDLDTFLTTIKGALTDLSTANLAKVLVAVLGTTVGLFLAWFGYRWVVRKVSGAIKKGRL